MVCRSDRCREQGQTGHVAATINRWLRDERGDGGGGALIWVLAMPAVFLLLFGGIQFGLTSYGKGVALAAAQAGVRAASSTPADPGRAEAATEAFISAKADGTLFNPTVAVSQSGGAITVTITAQTQSIVPGMNMSVTQSASGTLETTTP